MTNLNQYIEQYMNDEAVIDNPLLYIDSQYYTIEDMQKVTNLKSKGTTSIYLNIQRQNLKK